jgi:hypothetical protein
MESGSPEILTEGYVSKDSRRWICSECFRALQQEIGMETSLAIVCRPTEEGGDVRTSLGGLRAQPNADEHIVPVRYRTLEC